MTSQERIGIIFIKMGALTEERASVAAELAAKESLRFGEACLKLGLINEEHLAKALAQQYGLKVVDVTCLEIDEKTIDLIPLDLLHKARLVPVKHDGGPLIVTADPTEIHTLDDIERLLRELNMKPGKLAMVPQSYIDRAFKKSGYTSRVLRETANGVESELISGPADSENIITLDKTSDDSSKVVQLLDRIIFDAVSKRVSDIHLESGAYGMTVKYRIDGVLYKVMEPVDRRIQPSVISRLKVMSELDISERRTPQDGRFKAKAGGKAIDFRVSIMPGIHGEDAVIRILDKEHISREFEELTLESLGFSKKGLAHIRKMIYEPYGMFLVTGPTGSGKSTTLYAALSEINTGSDKIITIEDPVEYQLKDVTQIAVNEKKGLTFARGLRSILRHDPDKIMVGEIRDAETAQIAIQAALTGHLVFTTVHANNVFDVIGRFIHMGIEPYNFVSSLNCVLAQRLVRLLCTKCKRPVATDENTLRESGLEPEKYANTVFYEGAGCEECRHTGFRGRKAIMELLDLSDAVRDMIASRQPLSLIKKRAVEEGMATLREAAVECVIAGETTLKEINRVTFVE